MRTLEEIIKELETVGKKKVIQRNDLDDKIVINMPLLIATLDYLKEYRAEKGSLANARALTEEAYEKHTRWIENCKKAYDKYKSLELGLIHAHADLLDNPPLSWSDLRKMRDKPVFLEIYDGAGFMVWHGWEIVIEINGSLLVTHKDDYDQAAMGKLWNAYRKERE